MLGKVWAAVALGSLAAMGVWLAAATGAAQPGAAPVRAGGAIDFDHQVRPILERACWKCHGEKKQRSDLRLDSREAILKGGESGAAAVPGKSGESLMIGLVSGKDPDRVMPDQGPRLTAEEIGVLAAWIDQGMPWGTPVAARPTAKPYELALREVELPAGEEGVNPIDRLLGGYFREHGIAAAAPVDDRLFARRVFLDVVGMLPTPGELSEFLAEAGVGKRERLVRRLLLDNRRYAEHWLTFWNDALRNDYKGTGYIDGGREQITQWLFEALYNNMPYDRFVSELVSPTAPGSVGFSKGIVWRGVVNASQVPPMQAAQNVSQVFLGLNLKCASCHDSFINDWKLADAYGLAAVFSEGALEISRCDRPIGQTAKARFLYPQLGAIDADAPRAERMKQLGALLVKREDGRLSRTIVNRLWERTIGRGIVEPVDEMENEPWSPELLDWLAADLADHGYDLKRTLGLILTSRAYQMAAVGGAEKFESAAAFRGPVVRRMTAEQFVDAVRAVAGVWPERADAKVAVPGGDGPYPGPIRSALSAADPLMLALGRPNREQVVTTRATAATTLQAIELTNGAALDDLLRRGAQRWVAEYPGSAESLVGAVYVKALGREPTGREREEAVGLVGSPPRAAGVQDLLWAVAMLPEFQLIR